MEPDGYLYTFFTGSLSPQRRSQTSLSHNLVHMGIGVCMYVCIRASATIIHSWLV